MIERATLRSTLNGVFNEMAYLPSDFRKKCFPPPQDMSTAIIDKNVKEIATVVLAHVIVAIPSTIAEIFVRPIGEIGARVTGGKIRSQLEK